MVEGDDGETYAVMGDALVNLQLFDKRTGECKVNIFAVVTDVNDGGKLFNDSGKHISKSPKLGGWGSALGFAAWLAKNDRPIIC